PRPAWSAMRPLHHLRLRPFEALAVGLAAAVLATASAACDPFNAEFDEIEPARIYRASKLTEPDRDPTQLLVMSWNIKFGGGRLDFFFDCYGERAHMTKGEVLDNLEALAAFIRQVDPDVLLLQEVEEKSKRSAYVN